MAVAHTLRFLGQFLRRPASVGAVAPSSPALAQAMVQWIDWPHVKVIVEYGPGTGAFTGAILRRLPAGGRFFAIEINSHFAALLRQRFPGLAVYENSVANVQAVCQREDVAQVDAILCGLPWAAFPERDQDAYLEAMMQVLRPGGQFATFAYLQGLLLPAGRRFRRKLSRHFSEVTTSPTVWRNVPPAFVYRCRR